MKRKLDSNKIYKLIRGLVIITSVFFLINAVFLKINKFDVVNNYNNEYIKTGEFEACAKDLRSVEKCDLFSKEINETNKKIKINIVLGLGLLTIFFGGKGLINYIAPVVKKNEK